MNDWTKALFNYKEPISLFMGSRLSGKNHEMIAHVIEHSVKNQRTERLAIQTLRDKEQVQKEFESIVAGFGGVLKDGVWTGEGWSLTLKVVAQ